MTKKEINQISINKLDVMIETWTQRGKDLNIDFSKEIEQMKCAKCKYEMENESA